MGIFFFVMVILLAAWFFVRIEPLLGHPHIERLTHFHSSLAADRRKVVICLGDSLTHGNASFDYVHSLASRLEPSGYTVLNAGINSELAWNVLQRIDDVIRSEPAIIVLLIGTNDARACENPDEARTYVKRMKLPEKPDEAFFYDNYRALLDRLAEGENLRPILLTLPPLGERRNEGIDDYVDRFNRFIEEEAASRGFACLPLEAKLREYLIADSSEEAPAYGSDASNRLIYKALFFHYLLGWNWDRIAEQSGMRLLTDMIHLNERAGEILVDLVEAEIRRQGEGVEG